MKLNQLIAIITGLKERSKKRQTEVHHKLQSKELLTGISRTYRPKDDEGDRLPPQHKSAQMTVKDGLQESKECLAEYHDLVATLDNANCEAKADIKIGDKIIAQAVPVTHLLFLDKELVDLRTQINKLPTLDPAETWVWSNEANAYATKPRETTSTKKVRRNWVKAEATKEHPAQVEVFDEDIIVGYWETVNFSGAIPEKDKAELLDRVEELIKAVKCAREEANMMEVKKISYSKPILGYLFDETLKNFS